MARSRKVFQNTIRLVIELHGKIHNNKQCFNLKRINYVNIRINNVNIMFRFFCYQRARERSEGKYFNILHEKQKIFE